MHLNGLMVILVFFLLTKNVIMKRSELMKSVYALHPLGPGVKELLGESALHRQLPYLLTTLAARCFIDRHKEDEHTKIIRQALTMLEKHGHFTFEKE